MSGDEKAREKIIQDKGLNAPRLTPERINSCIIDTTYYHHAPTTTICVITLFNGFVVIGHCSCVSIDNFDEEIGRHVAYENARSKIWELEGYALYNKLHTKTVQ